MVWKATKMSGKLIVALDYADENEAQCLLECLKGKDISIKVGSEMFTRFGPRFVKRLVADNFRVFLDLKFHDIPNTVAKACKAAADLGVWMLNVHASGGAKMMNAAIEALEQCSTKKPLLLAVTVLTSTNEEDFAKQNPNISIEQQVTKLAIQAHECGLDGVVASAHETKAIHENCGFDFKTVTPGIRLSKNTFDDQSRVLTPLDAKKVGCDYIVVGRPITLSQNPVAVVDKIIRDFY